MNNIEGNYEDILRDLESRNGAHIMNLHMNNFGLFSINEEPHDDDDSCICGVFPKGHIAIFSSNTLNVHPYGNIKFINNDDFVKV